MICAAKKARKLPCFPPPEGKERVAKMEDEEKGKIGFFLVIENRKEEEMGWYEEEYAKKLTPFFASVVCVAKEPLFSACGEGVRYALLFRCDAYNGRVPVRVERY